MRQITGNRPLLLFFVSLEPRGYSRRRIRLRYEDYYASLGRLIQLGITDSIQIIVCENTVGIERSNKFCNLASVFPISRSDNLGLTNKGFGELSMALKALTDYPEMFKNTNRVIWMSGRHIACTDSIFEEAKHFKEDVLVSNPDFFFLNGLTVHTKKNGYLNDMFFSMKKSTFLKYMDFYNKNKTLMHEKNLGSEQMLCSFVTQYNLTTKNLTTLGLLRREYTTFFKRIEKSSWHIC